MVSIRINGSDSPVKYDGLSKISDLVELIKSMIDPDHMITGILLNGRDLDESEWDMSPSQFETSILEVETGSPEQFVAERMSQASDIVKTCYIEFRDARKAFQDSNMQAGNQSLIKATNILKAFFEWYATMAELVPGDKKPRFDITGQTAEITDVCKQICQQQLYQSWWALGETLEKELEPRLDRLEDFCRKANKDTWSHPV
jgi:hypothetical protein